LLHKVCLDANLANIHCIHINFTDFDFAGARAAKWICTYRSRTKSDERSIFNRRL